MVRRHGAPEVKAGGEGWLGGREDIKMNEGKSRVTFLTGRYFRTVGVVLFLLLRTAAPTRDLRAPAGGRGGGACTVGASPPNSAF